jgi:hypothetical protein
VRVKAWARDGYISIGAQPGYECVYLTNYRYLLFSRLCGLAVSLSELEFEAHYGQYIRIFALSF